MSKIKKSDLPKKRVAKKVVVEDIKKLIKSGYRISEGISTKAGKMPTPYWNVKGSEKKTTLPLFVEAPKLYLGVYKNGLKKKNAALVGPVLGFNGLIGVDLDTKHLKDEKEIEIWKARFLKLAESIPSAVIESTPSGGLHFYIRYTSPPDVAVKLVNATVDDVYTNVIEFYIRERWFGSYLSGPGKGYELLNETTFTSLKPINKKEFNRILTTLQSWDTPPGEKSGGKSKEMDDKEKLRQVVAFKEKYNLQVYPKGSEEQWFRCALIFSETFGGDDEGLELFKRMSVCDNFPKGENCEEKYSHAGTLELEDGADPVTIGTLVKHIEEAGGNVPELLSTINLFDILTFVKERIDQSVNEIFLDLLEKYPRHRKELPYTLITQILSALREKGEKLKYEDYIGRITPTEEDDENVVVSIYDPVSGKVRDICTVGNYSMIAGPKKSRKTLLTAFFVKQLAGGARVIIFDTEQGKNRVVRRRKMLADYCDGLTVSVLDLRGFTNLQRRQIIEEVVEREKPILVIIDGIRDLISDINNPAEANDLIYWLEKLTGKESKPHVIVVLHTNKGNGPATPRGHIGSELENKAENVFFTKQVENNTITEVSNPIARDRPLSTFAIRHDKNGDPEQMQAGPTKNVVAEDWHTLKTIFEIAKGGLTYTALKTHIMDITTCGKTASTELIKRAKIAETVLHDGKKGSLYFIGKEPDGASAANVKSIPNVGRTWTRSTEDGDE